VLSGGEKARLAMCKLLLHPYNVLILDEPTNHLDLKAKAVLKEALKSFDGSLIVVSHDRDFLADLTEFVYEVTPNRLKQYIGDIKNFLHEKHADSIGQYEASKTGERVLGKGKSNKKIAKSAPSKQKLSNEERKANDKAIRKAVKTVQRLEKSVAKAEEELKIKNEELSSIDPSDRKKMTDLSYEFENVQKKHDDLLQEWENALIEKENLES
jgi:ATP-binding cassette subfamily F protein 3